MRAGGRFVSGQPRATPYHTARTCPPQQRGQVEFGGQRPAIQAPRHPPPHGAVHRGDTGHLQPRHAATAGTNRLPRPPLPPPSQPSLCCYRAALAAPAREPAQIEEILRRCHVATFTDLWAHASRADGDNDAFGAQVYLEARDMCLLVQGNFTLRSDIACAEHWTVAERDELFAAEERRRRLKRLAELRAAGAAPADIAAAAKHVDQAGEAAKSLLLPLSLRERSTLVRSLPRRASQSTTRQPHASICRP